MIQRRMTTAQHPGSATRRAMACCAAVLFLGFTTPVPTLAQVSTRMRAQDIGINAAIGLATATVWALAQGHGLSDGVDRGLVGGAFMGIGRQIAASPFSGSGFAGREVSAVGISLITSVGSDHPRMSFPVGPIELQVVDGRTFDWRVNATDAVAAVINSTRKTTRLDLNLSLLSGTFVFRDRRAGFHISGGEATASEFFESITLAKDAFHGSAGVPDVLFHENVHVLQDDYLANAVTNPIEQRILNRTDIGRHIARHIDLGLLTLPLNGIANSLIPYASRPWEREAYALTPRHNY